MRWGRKPKLRNRLLSKRAITPWHGSDNQGNLYDEVKATFTMAEKEAFATVEYESNRAFDKDMPTKIWLCYVILVSICCARNNRPAWASIQNVSRRVGTTPISSVFWLGLIRCDCPEGLGGPLDIHGIPCYNRWHGRATYQACHV